MSTVGAKIVIRNLQKKIPIHPGLIKRLISSIILSERPEWSGEITVCFVSDQKIKIFNKKFLKENTATDVISFRMPKEADNKYIYADILVSTDMALSNTKVFKTSLSYELNLYVVHGILHLLGYNDRTLKQKQLMRLKELAYAHP